MPDRVRARVKTLPDEQLPAYVYDLPGLSAHAAGIAEALPSGVELYYAAKANPDAAVLRALAPHVDGFEVASGGEYAHVAAAVPDLPIAFGGPGKTPAELELAVRSGVHRLHVESEQELFRVAAFARSCRTGVDVLLRVNPPVDLPGGPAAVPLAMGGRPSPFGIDPAALERCAAVIADEPRLRLRGLHAHLASGLGADDLASLGRALVHWAGAWAAGHRLALEELNLGGGMAVDYAAPTERFAWGAYGEALARLATEAAEAAADGTSPAPTLRIEPGRAVTAYHGWYVTEVLDVKHSRGEAFAVVRGGTHHLRTPVARGHSQPFAWVPRDPWPNAWPRPHAPAGEPLTIVGQLCTPKDVLAARVTVAPGPTGLGGVDRAAAAEGVGAPAGLRTGDRVAFAMAGAYGWNISHRDFLMHPPPTFHHL